MTDDELFERARHDLAGLVLAAKMTPPEWFTRSRRERIVADVQRFAKAVKQLPEALEALRRDEVGIAAASYDRGPGGRRSVAWCWDHEREVQRCRRAGEWCTGEPVTVSDPTGERALSPDRLSRTEHELRADLDAMHTAAVGMVTTLLAHHKANRPT